jgi:dihydrofolate reductase
MRKLILQVQVSVDGFMADKDGRTDWQVWNWDEDWSWDEELKTFFNININAVDDILLSSKMATGGFIEHWLQASKNPNDPRCAYAKKINETHKVVFSRSGKKIDGTNITLASGPFVDEIEKLKSIPGKNMIVYGGATFVSALIKAGVVDEYQMFINPTAIGAGMQFFTGINSKLRLALVSAKAYRCGIAVVIYRPAKGGL